MWEHPDFPYHGWNFVFNNNDPMDIEGHGTHCAGTAAGDGTAGWHTGVAPNATVMALKVWDDLQYLGGANTMSSGFAFAVEHGAHVISMSGGVPQSQVTDADRILLRNTMVNTLEAGVIAAVASGNENGWYSPPNMVRCPSSCPPPWLHPDQTTTGGISCVMSVGATDINDNIASFSSRGPVTWQSVSGYNDYPYNPGMGLIRPDVCAPGVNITSLDYANPTGYVGGWSGTSMATPCVAGVMALMLSKNINLTPAEIDEILETTAVHLPNQSSPKGNIFGSGRIDAYAAIEAIICTTVNFTNQTVTTDTTVTSCGDIYVQDVIVTNGAKLTLDAAGETLIGKDFEVQLGSTLEIK
jgi:subtilisin family serine protease